MQTGKLDLRDTAKFLGYHHQYRNGKPPGAAVTIHDDTSHAQQFHRSDMPPSLSETGRREVSKKGRDIKMALPAHEVQV